MAWQNTGNNLGAQGQMAQSENNGAQAYTLQGVMRYLQLEWHKYERERNSWDIERDEMKRRIAHLEGEAIASKGLLNTLDRQIRMLELALRLERERNAKGQKGEAVDRSRDTKEIAREEIKKLKEQNKMDLHQRRSHFEPASDAEAHLAQSIRQDEERAVSKRFLHDCSKEIQVRIIPGTHPIPEPLNSHHSPPDGGPSQAELRAAYAEIQAQKQAQSRSQLQHYTEAPLAPPVRQGLQQQQQQQQTKQDFPYGPQKAVKQVLQSDQAGPPTDSTQGKLVKDLSRSQQMTESLQEEQDAQARQILTNDVYQDRSRPVTMEGSGHNQFDAWDFDDTPSAQMHAQPQVLSNTHLRPDTEAFPPTNSSRSPPRLPGSHRRKSSGARRSSTSSQEGGAVQEPQLDTGQFKVRFAMRGHLDVVRTVIFTGGGSPSDPEFATAGDDGTIKRWHIPASYANGSEDLDRVAHFTHRGHVGAICSLASCPTNLHFSNGGRVPGDGWIFSGGEDTSVKVWERGRVDSKATLDGHTDAVWALCVLPGTTGTILGDRCSSFGGPDRLLLVAGAADGTILVWAVSAPPQSPSGQAVNRGTRGSRRANSVSAGSNFPNSPQPSVASTTPFHYSLVHRIERPRKAIPTSISPLSTSGDTFVVSYDNADVLVFDTKTGEEMTSMASQETYDGTQNTGINAIVASNAGFDTRESVAPTRRRSMGDEDIVHGPTGREGGVEGLVIAGYEDRYIRFFDANSGQCTYTMLAHPSAISALSLSPDGRELVSGGHDASLRFWSLEKRNCTQEITNHRVMRGEGVCAVIWSQDGRWVVSAGGDGAVKVFSRA